jgi:RNA-splicing ligase RtcB
MKTKVKYDNAPKCERFKNIVIIIQGRPGSGAYKDIDRVIQIQVNANLIDVVHRIVPLINIKAK